MFKHVLLFTGRVQNNWEAYMAIKIQQLKRLFLAGLWFYIIAASPSASVSIIIRGGSSSSSSSNNNNNNNK
jgi:hypothetical protein